MVNKRKRTTYSPTAERRAVLYARYSSEQQRDSWSIDAQVADLRAHCQRMGWAVLDDVCIDEAISGKTEERPGLDRAMALIQAGKANVLVVHKLDRFFRNMAKTFEYVAELEEHGAGLVCTQQPIDTTNPVSGKIVLAVMAALAEIYLDNLSEETAKGKRARAAAGLSNGDLPYGYRNPDAGTERSRGGVNNSSAPMIVPEHAAAVRRAFELYATGQYSDARVARALNEEGYRMVSKRQPGGGPFIKDTMTALLANPFYIGMVAQPSGDGASNRSRDARLIQGQQEPIIDASLFDHVQTIRASKRGQGRAGSPAGTRHAAVQRHTYLAAGIARCRCCRERLRAQPDSPTKASYRDSSRERGIACTARRRSIPVDAVDRTLATVVGSLRLPDDWQVLALAGADSGAGDAERIEARRAALSRALERSKRLLLDGDITQAEYRAEKARIEAEMSTLAPAPATANMDRAAALLTDLGCLWDGAGAGERREIAARLFEAVYCDLDARRVVEVQLKRALLPIRSALPSVMYECGSDGRRSLARNHSPADRQAPRRLRRAPMCNRLCNRG